MKYIDADTLKAEVKRYKNKADERLKIKGRTFSEEQKDLALQNLCGNLLHFINSLQQEQLEPSNNLVDVDAVREDFITEVYRVLDADSTNDRANAIIDAFDSLPTVSQEQPEVDLVAELEHHLVTTPKEQLEKEWKELEPWNNVGPTVQEFLYGKQSEVDLEKEIDKFLNETGAPYVWCNDDEQKEWCNIIARHFYELGLNARKDKLPEIEIDKFIDKVDTFQGRYKHPEIVSIKGAKQQWTDARKEG